MTNSKTAALEFLPVVFFELALLILLPGKGLDHAYAGQVFLQSRGKDRFLFLVFFIALRYFFEEPQRNQQNERDDNHRNPGQLCVQFQQSDEVDDEQQHNASNTNGLLAEEAAQCIHIGCAAFDQVSSWRGAVIREAQPLDMVEQEVAQAARDSLSGISCQTAREIGKSTFEQRQPDKAEGNIDQVIGQAIPCV